MSESGEVFDFEGQSESWETAREKARKRDEFECVFCGMSDDDHKEEYGIELEVHHIVKRTMNGGHSVDNLATVCRSCHGVAESFQNRIISELEFDVMKNSSRMEYLVNMADVEVHESLGYLKSLGYEPKEDILQEDLLDLHIFDQLFVGLESRENRIIYHLAQLEMAKLFQSEVGEKKDSMELSVEYSQ